jgi:hypothetical protein
MGYTQDEIRSVVGKLLVPNIRHIVDTATGNRQPDVAFTDVQEAVAATFVLYPAAPLYVAKLSARKLSSDIKSYQDKLTDLYNAVLSLRRVDATVNTTTHLANTTSALMELEGAVSGGNFANLRAVPSYQRFRNSASSFLKTVKPSVVSDVIGGQRDVVPSKRQAMVSIPNQVSALPSVFSELHQNIIHLCMAMADYSSLNLPGLLVRNAVARSRKLLQARYNSMAGVSLEKQQELLRDATLEILAASGVLSSLAEFGPPPASPTVTGTVSAYADSSHLLTNPATIVTKQGPYLLRRGLNDLLHIKIDGAHDFDIDLPAIDEEYIEGFLPAPFCFNSGTASYVDSYKAVPYVFTNDATLTLTLEASPNGVYNKWDVSIPINAGTYNSWVGICNHITSSIAAQVGPGLFFCSTNPDATGMRISASDVGASYRITVMDGSANPVLGYQNGQVSVGGTYRNDQLVFQYKSAQPFTVTFPLGTQSIDTVVNTINNAITTAGLASKLRAVSHLYTDRNGSTKQYCRVLLLDAADPDVRLTVTGTTVPGRQPASGIGMEGEVSHLALTPERLAAFLGAFEDGGPPVRKLIDYLTAVVDGDVVRLTSKGANTTSSRIEVSGPASDILFAPNQTIGTGSSQWCVLSDGNRSLVEGDTLELYDTVTDTKDRLVILSRSDGGLLYTDLPMMCGRIYSFSSGGQFRATALRGDRLSFDFMVSNQSMVSFVKDDHSRFFSELFGSVNSMTSSKNPTEVEINTVLGMLTQHSSELSAIVALLEQFQAYHCKPVDDLFRMLRERGSDKAVDMLLQCRFTEFFGLDARTSSYAGDVMDGLQKVARLDLPIVKFDRVKGSRTVIAVTESPDYESDFSDGKADNVKYNVDKV